MRLPTKTVALPRGLTCPSRLVPRDVWLAHLVKHPLGIEAASRLGGKGVWNGEGWDRLTPPVVGTDERAALVRNIADLEVDEQHCGVPEFRRGRKASDLDDLACYRCPETLAAQCSWVLDAPSRAYAAVIDSLISGFEEPATAVVSRLGLTTRLIKLISRPASWAALTVLSVGLDDRSRSNRIARISRADGVRAEFYLRGDSLEWRTTWRKPPVHATEAMSFLLDFARPAPAAPLSDLCLVDRLWWESHGSQTP